MASGIYYDVPRAALSGQLDLHGGSFKVMIVTSGYVADPEHVFRSSVTNELTPSGSYAAGGAAVDLTVSRTGRVTTISVPATIFAAIPAGQNGRRAIVYLDTGNAATDRLVLCIDNGADAPTNGTSYTVSVTVAPSFQVPVWS